MKVLVLNCGSSSLKYQLIDMETKNALASGLVERIGIAWGIITHKVGDEKIKNQKEFKDHKDAINEALNLLSHGENAVVQEDFQDIMAIGHRVVHGGEYFSKSVIVTDEVLSRIQECSELAPLHNPANILGITSCMEIMPTKPNIAVFDTAFHQTMTPEHYLYAIPREYYDKYKIRRYGFHGTSHNYVSNRAYEILNKDLNSSKVITCHVGNGWSLAAIKDGKVVETSMGFTPLEWLIMGTRCGDLDPAILTFIMKKDNLSADEMDSILNKKSGLLGLTWESSDLRELEDGCVAWKEMETQVMNMYIDRIVKYIGTYTAILDGLDTIVLTAWAMENSPVMRKLIVDKLGRLWIKLDESKNDFRGKEQIISTSNSKVTVIVVPTNEELVIAKDTYELTK